jgi:hypothetical protein
MSNIQHSSRSDEWYTPKYLIDKSRLVLNEIDLDPASNEYANLTVNATKILTKKENGLISKWSDIPINVFLNPPGGKVMNKSYSSLFWKRLMIHRSQGLLNHSIFLGFSLEQLQTTQNCKLGSICNFPICIPKKRIKFVSKDGNFNAPTHSNVIVYIPSIENKTQLFYNTFEEIGMLMMPRIYID